jgi:hypothetical protein
MRAYTTYPLIYYFCIFLNIFLLAKPENAYYQNEEENMLKSSDFTGIIHHIRA